MFKGKNLEELDALMEALKQARKEVLAQEKENEDALIRETLKDVKRGDTLTIVFKGEEREALFDKLTEKRATVVIDGVKCSIQLDKIVSVA